MLPDLTSPSIELATFKVLEGTGAGGPAFTVQFNPASLEYTLSNEFDSSQGNNSARQFVKKTSGKLTMTLIFDTTDTGGDVRAVTANLAALLQPAKSGSKKFAPKVEFGWGSFHFKGVVEQYKETIDFFAASGVPLRASINLTLASQEVEFQSNKSPAPTVDRSAPEPVMAPPGAAPNSVASSLGDPRAARAIASANASASLRFGAEAGLAVGGEVTLSAAASFSASAGAGIGGGVSGGLSIGGGAGLGVGLDITATAGAAFTGLRVAPPTATLAVTDARAALLPVPAVAGAASFGPGGRARVQAGASLAADVGAKTNLGFGD
ncbi:MAG: hypothetical protein M0Z73_07630 [Betaproteobacteria bacterium]|nr:hypothetical protein [Betaproteobacteria bacterium]